MDQMISDGQRLRQAVGGRRFATILADPPWQFAQRTGKGSPEHGRLFRYPTMRVEDIMRLPVAEIALEESHLYLWVPNAMTVEGLRVMRSWGFHHKTNIIWHKVTRKRETDSRGLGFYFRNATELLLFGVRGTVRTLEAGRRQPNIIHAPKRQHSRKPDETYSLIESCSPGPFLELFAREARSGWTSWGDMVQEDFWDETNIEIQQPTFWDGGNK